MAHSLSENAVGLAFYLLQRRAKRENAQTVRIQPWNNPTALDFRHAALLAERRYKHTFGLLKPRAGFWNRDRIRQTAQRSALGSGRGVEDI